MPETEPTTERLDETPAAIETIDAAASKSEPEAAAGAQTLEAGIASVFATILAEDAPETPAPAAAEAEEDDALWALDAPLDLSTDDDDTNILHMPAFDDAEDDEDAVADSDEVASDGRNVTPLRRPMEEIPPEIRQIHELLTELDRLWSHAA